jgi:hypothetical protein
MGNRRLLGVEGEGENDEPAEVSQADWIKAISAVEVSLKVRQSGGRRSSWHLPYPSLLFCISRRNGLDELVFARTTRPTT